jgi:phosphatidylinositol alpha-1,6-mannosyltransferase
MTTSPKVPVLLTFDYPPARGGIQHYAERLAMELKALGLPTIVVAPKMPGSDAYDAAATATVRRFGGRGPLRVISAAVQFLRSCVSAGDRHTIALSWRPAVAAAIVPRRLRGMLTVLVHGTELDAAPGSRRERLLRFVFRRADRVVANSTFVSERTRALGLARIVDVVRPGVDARVVQRVPSKTPTVVFVGRLIARKGIDRLIAAIALLRSRDVALHVIGDGAQRATLEQMARDLGVEDRVHFAGAVDDDARDLAFSRAWCFAMPSRAEGGDVEGFGIVYLEAAMAGLPAIGGRWSGAEDAIVDGVTGLLVDGTDTQAIADAILALIDDPQRATAMGRAGRERALRDFSWRTNAQALAYPASPPVP